MRRNSGSGAWILAASPFGFPTKVAVVRAPSWGRRGRYYPVLKLSPLLSRLGRKKTESASVYFPLAQVPSRFRLLKLKSLFFCFHGLTPSMRMAMREQEIVVVGKKSIS